MGLSRALGCFRDSDAPTSKRKSQIDPQSKHERANRLVPDSKLKDKNNPTPTIGTRSYLLPPAPDTRGTKPPHTGNRIQETKRGPSDTTNKTAPGNSPRGTDSSQVPVERTVLGDDYEPEPWSMGAVRRRTSMLPERKSPVVTSTEEKIPNEESQPYQQSAFSQDVYAYWMSKGSPVRAIDLLGLPSVDVKQLRAKGSGVAQGDEAEGVIVEEYTGPIRPAWSRPKS